MILSELFTQINSAYRGSDDDVPAISTPDFTLWLATTNRKISEWAGDGKNTWKSLFEIRDIGTASAGTQTYDLDADISLPADSVIVTKVDGQKIEYTLCEPQERGRFAKAVYISGRDPQELTFNDTITATDPIVGGTIKVAGFYVPDNLTSLTETIPVDDPYWLVYAVASELAFNDLTYESKAADLNAKANNLYSGMVSNNRRGTSSNPRTVPVVVKRIRGPHSEPVWGNW